MQYVIFLYFDLNLWCHACSYNFENSSYAYNYSKISIINFQRFSFVVKMHLNPCNSFLICSWLMVKASTFILLLIRYLWYLVMDLRSPSLNWVSIHKFCPINYCSLQKTLFYQTVVWLMYNSCNFSLHEVLNEDFILRAEIFKLLHRLICLVNLAA